ncbi:MAG: MBL fold metallo-hydrolase [Micrococcales bacterium]|nr:MBL fold metallo-hydrolase [Micrococcales bacterium]
MSPRASCVLCPNASAMTLEGTNTWVLSEPGSSAAIVLDPGPLDEGHLQAVLGHVADTGRRVALTLLTHGHDDHAGSADRFAQLSAAPVRAFGRGHDDVRPGETIRVGGLEILAVHTPGHTSDSFSFVLPADNMLLTGDTILGRGTTVVAWPDGNLEDYLESLDRLERLTRAGTVTSILPGHGPFVPDAAATVTYYLGHRAERLDQVRAAITGGTTTAREVVELVYADVPRELWPAAELSVEAQLAYLRTHS